MNTLLYLWTEPLIMNRARCDKKVYFNTVINGDHSNLSTDELDKLIEGSIMADIMDYADIESNWNFAVIEASATDAKPFIEFSDSPTERKHKKEIAKVLTGEKELKLNKETVIPNDDGTISVNISALGVSEKIDFPKIWGTIEEKFINKIQPGDQVILTDDEGNKLFEVTGGSFLNIALADVLVKDATKDDTYFTPLKGGVFIREDGSLDIGDYKRTIWVQIYTDNLLKASFKLNKSLMDITNNKLLK